MATRNATRKAVKPQVTAESSWPYTVYCPNCESNNRSKTRRMRCLNCGCDEVTCRIYTPPVNRPGRPEPKSPIPTTAPRFRFAPGEKCVIIERHGYTDAFVVSLHLNGDVDVWVDRPVMPRVTVNECNCHHTLEDAMDFVAHMHLLNSESQHHEEEFAEGLFA